MTGVDDENKLTELQDWAIEALELLDEVKPYRSIFYKQRVAKLKSEFKNIVKGKPSPSHLSSGTGCIPH